MKKLVLLLMVLVAGFLLPTMANAVQIIFIWDGSTSTDVSGYRLYNSNTSRSYSYGAQNAIWTGTALTATVTVTVQLGETKYFVVTAYNSAGESGPSNEVFYTVPPDNTEPSGKPAKPTNLRITIPTQR